MKNITKSFLKELTYQVNGAAIEVHKILGPGLLESIYRKCLCHELTLRGIRFQNELFIPINFKDLHLSADIKCDVFVEDCLVVETKAVKDMIPVYEAQILTYMNLLTAPKGIMYNFFCTNLYTEGTKTYVNEYFRGLPD